MKNKYPKFYYEIEAADRGIFKVNGKGEYPYLIWHKKNVEPPIRCCFEEKYFIEAVRAGRFKIINKYELALAL